ncbi:MAG: hypothetical protein ACOYVG_01130 [Bacteroidota bacterium]
MRVPICLIFCLSVQLIYCKADAAVEDTSNVKIFESLDNISIRQLSKLKKKYENAGRAIAKFNHKTIAEMRAQEERVRRETDKAVDSSYRASYSIFENNINTQEFKKERLLNDYLSIEDSLQTGMEMLNKILPSFDPAKQKAITDFSEQLKGFQTEWQKHTSIQDFISKRRDLLKDKLKSADMGKELKQINKQIFYYQKQINEFRELLKSPDALVSKFIGILREQPKFGQLMATNSQLAQLFRLPGQTPAATTDPLPGLQTRAATSQLLQQQFQGEMNPSAYFQQQLNAANAEMDKWKKKINELGGGSAEMGMPDFKPNHQKTKTFLKRIEWGANIQSQRPNGLFPVTSDLALTTGYKLNDKSVIGVGIAYKMGWGKNFSNIRISHQGLGLRSFLDIKLKGNFWISGGYELNYMQEFNRIDQLKGLNAWQKSGLIGLSKKYMIVKRKGNLQLLWDFLSYSQLPRTQTLKFRIGYLF